MENNKPTYYRFNANIRKFVDKLKGDPIHADVTDMLKELGFTKDKLIKALMKRNIIKRKESIKDQTNSDYGKPTYIVRYTILADNFADKTEKMYKDYMNEGKTENTFPKHIIKEDGEGGVAAGDGGAVGGGEPQGATNAESSGQYDVPFLATGKSVTGNVISKPIGRVAESKKPRRIYITESQLCDLLNNDSEETVDEATDCAGVGDFAYDANPFKGSGKKGDKFWGDAMSRPKGGIMINIKH